MKKLDYFIGIVAIFAFLLLIAQLSSYFDHYAHLIKFVNFIILSLFICDVLCRFIFSKDRKNHIRRNWLDFIVFIPLLQFVKGIQNTSLFVILWQIVIVLMLVSRVKRANKFITLLSLKPAQLMVASFASAIGVGTVLLMLPIATKAGIKTSLVDAVFTATSATCVTGLIVKDTAGHFSAFGQAVILALIQIGGLGIMTFSVSLVLFLSKRIEMQRRIIMQEVLDQSAALDVKTLVLFIAKMTLSFELVGAACLFVIWRDRFPGVIETAYHAVFHSISAFCNAGFSTFSDSLKGFSGDIYTNVVICLLIFLGGLGFTVVRDIYDNLKSRFQGKSREVFRFRTQTKIVLTTSIVLILIGAAAIYAFERYNTFSGMGDKEKILCSVFQSITSRTAGFNTCDISGLSSATFLIMMVLMFIGGSPGSTAGGIKTTTAAILWATITSGFKQSENTETYKRTIPAEAIKKTISVFAVSLGVVVVFCLSLLYVERKIFSSLLFEAMSAFGTVGLSTGITPALSLKGKILITALMFVGRLGPLTIGYAFTRYRRPARYRYAEERVMIG